MGPSLGVDWTTKSNAMLETLRLPSRLITPFLVLVVLSYFTPRNSREVLDRYYAKMKTPVDPNREVDRENLHHREIAGDEKSAAGPDKPRKVSPALLPRQLQPGFNRHSSRPSSGGSAAVVTSRL